VFNIVGLWDSRKKSKKPMKIGCSIMSHYVKAREKGRDGVLDETINHTMNHPFFFQLKPRSELKDRILQVQLKRLQLKKKIHYIAGNYAL